jgi:hypothetical protein
MSLRSLRSPRFLLVVRFVSTLLDLEGEQDVARTAEVIAVA